MNVITNTTVLPERFESVQEAAEFWGTHSLADYWDQMHEVEIEVRAHRRRVGKTTRTGAGECAGAVPGDA